MKIDDTARIHKDVELNEGSGTLIIGANCHIKKGVVINCYGGTIIIKKNVSIGEYTIIYGHGDVTICDNVAIAPHCVISSQKHIFPADVPLRYSGEIATSVLINQNSIISAHVVISNGISIGSDSIIGSGSIVTKNIESSVFAYGTPCKVVKTGKRNPLYGYTEDT